VGVRDGARALNRIPAPAAFYLDGSWGTERPAEHGPRRSLDQGVILCRFASPMSRQHGAMAAAAAAALAASVGSGPPARAAPARAPDPKKVQAEHNVLRFLEQDLGRRWVLRHRGGRGSPPPLHQVRGRVVHDQMAVLPTGFLGHVGLGPASAVTRSPTRASVKPPARASSRVSAECVLTQTNEPCERTFGRRGSTYRGPLVFTGN
jgi:hypothetical protein